MSSEIGRVEAVFRYPVKSMAGERCTVIRTGQVAIGQTIHLQELP